MLNSTNQFMGFDGFIWFQGVVEDRMDPLQLGRVRVRILGIHTEQKDNIPTADLPWAYPMQPITSAAMSGIGTTPLGPVPGTWVVGFFRDGENCQEPVIMGTLGGIPQAAANTNIGFNDPSGTYPNPALVGEADTNRLARNYKTDTNTYLAQREANLVTGIPVALQEDQASQTDPDVQWDEPYNGFNAQYPFNHVYQSESGHVVEYDDTPNNTRIMHYHNLGTFQEIYQDVDNYGNTVANRITKINGNDYSIIIDDKNMYVQGSLNITIDGRCNILANNDINIEANSGVNLKVANDLNITSEANVKIDSAADIMLNADGDITLNGTNVWINPDNGTYVGGSTFSASTSDAISISSLTSTSISSMINTSISSSGALSVSTVGILNLSGTSASINSQASSISLVPATISLTAPTISNISSHVTRIPSNRYFDLF